MMERLRPPPPTEADEEEILERGDVRGVASPSVSHSSPHSDDESSSPPPEIIDAGNADGATAAAAAISAALLFSLSMSPCNEVMRSLASFSMSCFAA